MVDSRVVEWKETTERRITIAYDRVAKFFGTGKHNHFMSLCEMAHGLKPILRH